MSYSIYRNILDQPNWQHSWQQIKQSFVGEEAWKPLLVVLLMFFNWGIEALKWKVLVNHIQRLSFFTSFKAILSGLSVSLALNTPNGTGEYVGRVLYIKEGNRIRVIALTFIGSLSQLIVTILMGTIGLYLMHEHFISGSEHGVEMSRLLMNAMMLGSAGLTVGLLLIYFKISWLIKLIEKIPLVAKYSYFIKKLEEFEWKELLNVLLLSVARYGIFVVQYLLMLHLFKVEINIINSLWLITVMFLVLAIVPTIALAEVGVRGKVSMFLFGAFSTNSLGIVFTATAIWLINLVVPALAGSLFILGIKLYKGK